MRERIDKIEANSRKLKIGIIGGGISGLVAGWLLSHKHDVTLYESKPRPGIYAEAIDLEIGGKTYNCDIPGRIMIDLYYQKLIKLCEYLGVELQKLKWGVSFLNESLETYFSYRSLGRLTVPIGSSWTLKNIGSEQFWKRMYGYFLFISKLKEDIQSSELDEISFGEYMKKTDFKYKEYFYKEIIGGCNVTLSCNNREVENYPAGIIINYFYRLMTSRVYRIKGGVKNIVPKLVANLTLKTESPIAAVQRDEKKISLKVKEEIVDFDHVIFATSPASTLDILGNSATIEEKSIFESFSYANTKMYLHTDKKVQKDFPSMLNIIISEKFDYAPFNRPLA